MEKPELEKISLELQRLAFNMADVLDTLNFHSINEAVSDLRGEVFSMSAEMAGYIKTLRRNMRNIAAFFPALDTEELESELSRMDLFLDLLRKCTGDAKNYREFVENLIPLLRLCEKWGERDPLSVSDV